MPRYTKIAWWCGGCQTRNPGPARTCSNCGTSRIERHAQVHQQDRAVVYYNPATGERRTPARVDQPLPAVYAAQGFERREILNMTAYERETGLVHEASNFAPGNEPAPFKEPERRPMAPEVRAALIDDLREAAASGPWTESENSPSKFTIAAPV